MSNVQRGNEAVRASGSAELCRGYERYEYVRTLTPRGFRSLYEASMDGACFDDLVDQGIEYRTNALAALTRNKLEDDSRSRS